MIQSFTELPKYIRTFLQRWMGSYGQAEIEQYIRKKIPALGNKSILEVFNEKGGEKQCVDFLNRAAHRINVPYVLKMPE
jgi:hypothetical protein